MKIEETTYLSGWAVFRYAAIIFLAGVAVGVMGHMVYINETTDTGTVMIDGKQWHMERDSIIASRDSTAAVNVILVENMKAKAAAERRADSIAGVLATIRLERIARHDYRRYGHPELDSVIRSRYSYRNARE